MWRKRHRFGMRGRLPKPVTFTALPPNTVFTPNPIRNPQPILIEFAQLEALKLVDQEGLSQKEAGEKMSISRGTIWRLVQEARKKVAQALNEGRPIIIATGPNSQNSQNQ